MEKMMDLKKLKDVFPEDDIEWRIGRCGVTNGKVWATCLAYISARAVQDRLDEVCGAENWRVVYAAFEGKDLKSGVIAEIFVNRCGVWIGKQDGADQTDTEPFKGGISGAFKRAACAWGVGRYLYSLEEGFAQVVDKGNGARYAKTKEGQAFYWIPPKLPEWAVPPKEENLESTFKQVAQKAFTDGRWNRLHILKYASDRWNVPDPLDLSPALLKELIRVVMHMNSSQAFEEIK